MIWMKTADGNHRSCENGLLVITGGPGTGKTTTINAIIRYFEMEGLDIIWQRLQEEQQSV